MSNRYIEDVSSLAKSFSYAFRGFRFAVDNERNMRIHLSMTVLVTEFAVIYRFLRAHGGWNYGLDVLCNRIQEEEIGCGKLCVILSIMDELNLIRFYLDGDHCEVSLLEVSKKVDLNSSRILSGLRKQRCGEQYA